MWLSVWRTDSGLPHLSSTVCACPVTQKFYSLGYFIMTINKISGLQKTVKYKGYTHLS